MFNTLRSKMMIPVWTLTLVAMALTAPPLQRALQIEDQSWTPLVLIALFGIVAAFLQSRALESLLSLRARMRRAPEGVSVGEPSLTLDEELREIWAAGHALQQQVEGHRSGRHHVERDVERIATAVDLMRQGLDAHTKLALKHDEAPWHDLLGQLKALNAHLNQSRELVDDLKRGELQTQELTARHLEVKRLTESDLPIPREVSGLHEDLLELQNALRRLTLQTHLVASDRLESALLDEVVPGELGDAYAAMVETLRALGKRAQRIAAGDLSLSERNEGSLHEAFDAMVSGLRDVVSQLTQTAVRISTSAEEILAVLHEQELSASHQASGVEETQRTMETLLSSAKKIAESAQTVFKSAERAQANNRIISDRAGELKSHTERIAEILETIKEIADRSDLLALNASLEGLRAGEAGKGFTLVANEMRRLAENVKGSVGDIKALLESIRQSALSNIMAIEEGSRLSERTTDSALKITLITQQQQSGTEQVTQSMEELSHLINQGLAGTRQVTAAASELADLSDDMRGLVDTFDLGGDAGAALAAANLAPRLVAAPQRLSYTTPSRAMAPLYAGSPHAGAPQGRALGSKKTLSAPMSAIAQQSAPAAAASSTEATSSAPASLRATRGALGAALKSGATEELNATQLAIHLQRAGGEAPLSATMRLRAERDDAPSAAFADASPTLDVSKMSAELLSGDYDEMDSLFHELDAPQPSAPQGTAQPDEAPSHASGPGEREEP